MRFRNCFNKSFLILVLTMFTFGLIPSTASSSYVAWAAYQNSQAKKQSQSDSDNLVVTGAAILGIGVATYFFIKWRKNDEKEQLRLLDNYSRGYGVRLTPTNSRWSVDILDSGRQFKPWGVEEYEESQAIHVGLVTVRF